MFWIVPNVPVMKIQNHEQGESQFPKKIYYKQINSPRQSLPYPNRTLQTGFYRSFDDTHVACQRGNGLAHSWSAKCCRSAWRWVSASSWHSLNLNIGEPWRGFWVVNTKSNMKESSALAMDEYLSAFTMFGELHVIFKYLTNLRLVGEDASHQKHSKHNLSTVQSVEAVGRRMPNATGTVNFVQPRNVIDLQS